MAIIKEIIEKSLVMRKIVLELLILSYLHYVKFTPIPPRPQLKPNSYFFLNRKGG